MKVYIIGIGMGNTMTEEARNAINESQCIIGAKRMIGNVERDVRKIEAIAPHDIAYAINCANHDVVSVLFSGDIGFYSGAKNLFEMIKQHDVHPICGVSTVSYFCAKLMRPWQDMKLVSLHGRNADVVNIVMRNKESFFLTDAKCSPAYICSELVRAGLGDAIVTVGENLSYKDENIARGSAVEFAKCEFNALSAVIIDNNNAKNSVLSMRDDEFIRGNTPMTKQEVRSVVLSKLALKPTDIAYDVGGGTGSVSIEMAQGCGRVYSVECDDGALELMRQNREKFFAHNMEIVEGKAPEALENLPSPHAVFIGGTRGNMAEILACVVQKNPKVRVVVTAIALETLALAVAELSKYCEPSVVNICVSRNKKVGNYNMMTAENPIYIVGGELGV